MALLCRDVWRVRVDLRGVAVDRPRPGTVAPRTEVGTVRRAEPGPAGPSCWRRSRRPTAWSSRSVDLPPHQPTRSRPHGRPRPVRRDCSTTRRHCARSLPVMPGSRACSRWSATCGCRACPESVKRSAARSLSSSCRPPRRAVPSPRSAPASARLPAAGCGAGRPPLRSAPHRRGRCAAAVCRPAAPALCTPARWRTPAWSGQDAVATGAWSHMDRRLRALPGVGPWTSAEVRLRLGDPDAVSVGDDHLPKLVGDALGDPGPPPLAGPGRTPTCWPCSRRSPASADGSSACWRPRPPGGCCRGAHGEHHARRCRCTVTGRRHPRRGLDAAPARRPAASPDPAAAPPACRSSCRPV